MGLDLNGSAIGTAGSSVGTPRGAYGATAGAGVEYFVSRPVALDVGVSHSRGQFTAGTFKGDGFASTRLNIGVKWHL